MTVNTGTETMKDTVGTSRSRQEGSGGLWDSVKKAAFVIGSGLLFLAAFSNSLTWHLQRFWGASGDFWQNLWTKLYLTFEGHDAALFFLGTMLVPFLAFWVSNGLLLLVDTTGKPSFITRYRIQVDKNNPVDPVKLRHAVKTVLFNQVFISGPMVVAVYYLMTWRGNPCGPELPTFHWGLMEFALYAIMEEILFYYSHRAVLENFFHVPKINWKRRPTPQGPNGQLSIDQYRLVAYRVVLEWVLKGECLGRGNRRVLPSCIVTVIRSKFPSPTGTYIGLKEAEDMFRIT